MFRLVSDRCASFVKRIPPPSFGFLVSRFVLESIVLSKRATRDPKLMLVPVPVVAADDTFSGLTSSWEAMRIVGPFGMWSR